MKAWFNEDPLINEVHGQKKSKKKQKAPRTFSLMNVRIFGYTKNPGFNLKGRSRLRVSILHYVVLRTIDERFHLSPHTSPRAPRSPLAYSKL